MSWRILGGLTPRCLTGEMLLPLLSLLVAAPLLAQPTPTATYRVTFDATWSRGTHPDDFPQSAHFSSLIGASHSDAASFWQPGAAASPGIENMAELGGTATLAGEVDAAIAAGQAHTVIRGGSVSSSPGTASAEVELTLEFHRVTLVSMIAPSPDWFVGTHGLSLIENGEWRLRFEIPLFAYDAGTDSGATFTASNRPTIPAQPIRRITTFPLEDHGPLGSLVFERLDPPSPPSLVLGPSRFEVSARWRTKNGSEGFGRPNALTADTGTFWFFDPANVELVVKVLDACSFAQHYWVFAGGLTDVEVELTVRDTVSATVRTYLNRQGSPFEPIQDTQAFPACP